MARMKKEGIETEILSFIQNFINVHQYSPSVREIGTAVGFKSPSTIFGYLKELEKDGKITMDSDKTRTIKLTSQTASNFSENSNYIEVPVIGTVAAGQPILAYENFIDSFPLPSYFSRKGEIFMLKVQGDSMINAGILDGDYVIVQKQNTAHNHEIVVAMYEGEATVKRFYKELNGGIRLQPENDMLEPIYLPSVEILGKVAGVIRTSVS